MKEITIKIVVPDGTDVQVTESSPSVAVTTVIEDSPASYTLEDLRRAFVAAVKMDKEKAFKALNAKTCSDVSTEDYNRVIGLLKRISDIPF
jgi:hypothetical protein